MLPPKDAYTVLCANETSEEVRVTIVYQLPNAEHTSEEVELLVPANQQVESPEKTMEMGSATFVAFVKTVKLHPNQKGGFGLSSEAALHAPFPGVDSPVRKYGIKIVMANGNQLKLHAAH